MSHRNEDPPQTEAEKKTREHDIASHIFSNSTVMLGLCLTIISVVHSQKGERPTGTIVDDIIAMDSLIFLVACFLSYAVLRSRHLRSMHRVEAVADIVFLIGMTGMAIASVLFVWTLW